MRLFYFALSPIDYVKIGRNTNTVPNNEMLPIKECFDENNGVSFEGGQNIPIIDKMRFPDQIQGIFLMNVALKHQIHHIS